MTFRFPRQDSTACQIRDVEMEARNRAMVSPEPLRSALEEGVQWLVAWQDDYPMKVSDAALQALRSVAVEHLCYDADDAMLMRAGKHNLNTR